jgi:putative RNA 2'-phosphotransferase
VNADAQVQLSKTLSWVLRHEPGALGLEPDEAGWVLLEDLAVALRDGGRVDVTDLPGVIEHIEEVVRTSEKNRFEILGERIRARQGHSVNVDLGYAPTAPPEVLFHGTTRHFLGRILQEGLQKQGRHHVHLSSDANTARAVGRRHGAPVVLRVDASGLHAEGGADFFVTDNGVWLVDHVPREFLEVHES